MKVSIISPVYKEPSWMVNRNFFSVSEQQTLFEFEHIFVLDNPEPDEELSKELGALAENSWVQVVRHNANKGLSSARNTALSIATGDYIMLLDADDVMVQGRIERQISFMIENGLDHCYGGYQEIHGNNKEPMGPTIIPPEYNFDYLKNLNNICYCGSNCFKKSVYEEIGGFDESMHDGAEDLEYWIRIGKNKDYKVGLLPEVLYYLGIHSDNMTAKLIASKRFDNAYKYIQHKHVELYALPKKPKAELDFWRDELKYLTRWSKGELELYNNQCPTKEQRREFEHLSESHAAVQLWNKYVTKQGYLDVLEIDESVFEGAIVADIGGGPTSGLAYMQSPTKKIIVEPLLDKYIESGYPKYNDDIEAVCSIAEEIPLPDNCADIVVTVNALDHVDDVDKTVAEIRRILKPNGKIILHVTQRKVPTICEPQVLTDEKMEALFSWCEGFKKKELKTPRPSEWAVWGNF